MLLMSLVFALLTHLVWLLPKRYFSKRKSAIYMASHARRKGHAHFIAKPVWTIEVILELKARLPKYGCRKLADEFNRLYFKRTDISVSKSWVANILKRYRYAQLQAKLDFRQRKHRVPPHMPKNKIWALDTTYINDIAGQQHIVFGIIDHGSRLLLSLRVLKRFNAWSALGCMFLAIGQFGRPCAIRSDNHPVFHSARWKKILNHFYIRRQYSKPFCPWQNGRIERLFGTFKQTFKDYAIYDAVYLKRALTSFHFYYNWVRPHQHLYGQTPQEAWNNIDPYTAPTKQIEFVSLLDGNLCGHWLRR